MQSVVPCQAGIGTLLSKKEVLKHLLEGTVDSLADNFFEEKDGENDVDNGISSTSMQSH